jgi:hypothetical protein
MQIRRSQHLGTAIVMLIPTFHLDLDRVVARADDYDNEAGVSNDFVDLVYGCQL